MDINRNKDVLLVEDHAPLRQSLEELIAMEYHVRSARDPIQAMELIRQHKPDIIITDVMMPEQDGFQFVKILKTHEEYKTIPVIFLTALSDANNLAVGFDSGGIDYITKPFSNSELMARVKAILNHTSLMQEYYEKQSIHTGAETTLKSDEDRFSEQIIRFIDANFDNPALSVTDISKHMNMSISTLKRWCKKTHGTTVAILVKNYRLTRAEIMIRQGIGSIAEVSARCGFSTQQYFSRCFKEAYGHPPHTYRVKMKSGD